VTLAGVRKANHFYSTLGQDYHLENIQWSGKKILNSCSNSLKDKIMEATAHLPNSEQGGPTFWKVLMDLVIATSETAMRCIINKIATVQLSDFNGEDVTQCTTFLQSSYMLLKNNNRIPVDMIYLLFQTLRKCSTPYFVRRVEYCEQNRLSKIGGYDTISYEDLLNDFQIPYADILGRNGWEAKATDNQGSVFNVKGSSLVGTAAVMDTVLKTVPSQETSPILKRERNCGRAQEMLNPVVGMEEETVTIEKMVVGMDKEEEVAIIVIALITRTLVPAVLTEKSLLK